MAHVISRSPGPLSFPGRSAMLLLLVVVAFCSGPNVDEVEGFKIRAERYPLNTVTLETSWEGCFFQSMHRTRL